MSGRSYNSAVLKAEMIGITAFFVVLFVAIVVVGALGWAGVL